MPLTPSPCPSQRDHRRPCALPPPLLAFARLTPAHALPHPPADFHIFQYFLSVVSTTYINAARRLLHTNQYSVTEMSRTTEHGKGVPGIFFKFDIEPMALTVRERTSSVVQFLVRLAGILGGILGASSLALSPSARARKLTPLASPAVCSDFGFRTADFFAARLLATSAPKTPLPVGAGFVPHGGAKTPTLGSGFASGFGRD